MSFGHVEESCGCSWLPHKLPIATEADFVMSSRCSRHATKNEWPQILASVVGTALPSPPDETEIRTDADGATEEDYLYASREYSNALTALAL